MTSPTRATRTRNAMAKVYAAGILVFIGIFGLLTLVSVFLTHLET